MEANKAAGTVAGAALVALCVWAGVEGIALLERAADMPAFTDPDRAIALRRVSRPADREAWWREMNALLTGKWELLDRGRGLVALALTGLAAVALLRPWDVRHLARARTPRSAKAFLLFGASAWAGLVVPGWIWFHDLYHRDYLPMWGEMVAIPMFGWTIAVLAPLPVVVGLTWAVALRRARLPASLWLWDRARPVRSAFWTTVCGALLAPLGVFLAAAVDGGFYLAVPLAAVLIYLVLSARAAVLSSTDAPPRVAVAAGPARARAGRNTGAVRG